MRWSFKPQEKEKFNSYTDSADYEQRSTDETDVTSLIIWKLPFYRSVSQAQSKDREVDCDPSWTYLNFFQPI